MTSDVDSGVVVVTGASGGLGGAVVQGFVDAGLAVLATEGRHRVPVEHPDCFRLPVNFSAGSAWISDSLDPFFRRIRRRLVGVVHCAGVIHDGLLVSTTVADWDRVMRVNLDSAMHLSRWALGVFQSQQSGGHVVMIGSNSGARGSAGQAAYSASKAALKGLVQSLAREAGASGVCFNLVLPGFLETRMTDALTPEVLDRYRGSHVLGRFTTPEESARLICLLVTGMPSVSGQVFQLDSRIGA